MQRTHYDERTLFDKNQVGALIFFVLNLFSGESSGGEDTIVIHSTPIQDPVGDQAHDYHCKLVKYVQLVP